MKAIKIPHDITKPMEAVDIDKGWQAMASAIGGEYIERVRIGDYTKEPSVRFEDAVLIVDEVGMPKRLPVNLRAALLYGLSKHGWPKRLIFGDALVVGEGFTFDSEEGPGTDFCDLPEDKPLEFWQRLIDRMAVAVDAGA